MNSLSHCTNFPVRHKPVHVLLICKLSIPLTGKCVSENSYTCPIFSVLLTSYLYKTTTWHNHYLGPVVLRPITAWPRVKFDPDFFFLCSKAFSWIIFSVIFRASNHQLVDKKNQNWKAFFSNLNSNLALTLGYLNPALNNSDPDLLVCPVYFIQ